ncbi:DUF1840 family protein [Pseudohongiella sp.]|uniref:DUF1840 domain-containing protein n=1 Tax=marine sediment metagenome TaxID=412755 RepID=A0A0F9W3H5_9ZZZZ|nr:DUF1840 family protein [Pseudohongiella sp.]HDZ08290.1 DUF1840 domain-containing protein [Pseudohongiella sp.]HEA62566.1 DUF1840 domain-containing protein [Pseudohongiella sp.]
MLLKFYSEESAGFVMLDSAADQLLTMMGQGGSKKGAVSGETLTAALDRLTSAIAHEQDKPASDNPDEKAGYDDRDDEDSDEPEDVPLSARAAPLIAMLRRASDADGYVMWRPE